MKIESYDPYHIGIKLNAAISIPIFRQKLIQSMKESGFQVTAPEQTIFNMPTEVLTTVDRTRIEFNYVASALNTVGADPKETTSLFEKLLNLLVTMGYELDAFAVVYEVVSNINVKSDDVPADLLNKSINCDLDSWKELNKNVNVTAVQIQLFDSEYGKETMAVTVSPNAVRSKTTLLFGVRYSNIEKDKIIDFSNKLENRIIKFAESLGKK